MWWVLEMPNKLEQYLDTVGEVGSKERLRMIARLRLGKRSEAAQRALKHRYNRSKLISTGLTVEEIKELLN